jgi:spore germination protein
MDKKKVIKWTTAILANLAALVAIFLTANPQLTSKARKTKRDSLDSIASAHFVPSYSKSAHPGMLSRVVNVVHDSIVADIKARDARPRKMNRQDTVINRGKTSIHEVQRDSFERKLYRRKYFLAKNNNNLPVKDVPYSENEWDELNGIKATHDFYDSCTLKSGIQVFGWHPYWMGSAYKNYNFGLLSTIAYYGAEFDPRTGNIDSTHGWERSGLCETALRHNCSVELTIINTGENNSTDFLSNTQAQYRLINNIIDKLGNRGDGVCLDFEDVPTNMNGKLVDFVTALRDTLKNAPKLRICDSINCNDTFSITMVLPCFDWTGAYDVKKLAPLVDRFVVTGYDYYGSFDTTGTTGPVAPLNSGLKWRAPNIESSVKGYLKKGVPPAKLLLGLPYYGVSWKTLDGRIPSTKTKFLGFNLYRDIQNGAARWKTKYDTASVSAYYTYYNDTMFPAQCWYDNAETLSEKYRWVLRNRIGGIGIWALGYDNGRTELWQALADNFARDRLNEDTTYASKFILAKRDTTSPHPDKEWGIVAANGHYLIFDSPYVLLYSALGLFALILLLQVLLDQQPFNELFSKRLVLFILASLAGTAAIIFLGLALWSKVPHREIYLLLAGIIGGYLLFRLTQRIVGKNDKLP